jgi:osmotically-inducible protein OsmY
MVRQFSCSLLLLSALLVCQAHGQEPAFTSTQAATAQAQQPEQPIQASLQEKAAANDQIQSNLQSALDDDPLLSGADVGAKVDDEGITLTGTVQSYRQHERVLELASSYSRSRNIVDKINVQ